MADAAIRYGDATAVGKLRPLLALLGDDRLVEQVRRGSHAAFEALYERHHRGILAFCRHMLGTAHDAEEAVQQTFTAAYADLTAGARPESPKPWLYGVARHRCLAIVRRRRTDAGTRTAMEVVTPPLVDEVERRTEMRDLLTGVSRLPEPQRTALVLFGLCGHPQADVAAVIGCDEPRVRALVYQARSSLLADRRARETPCHEVREKLALGRGAALRRRSLRRHVKFCPGCAEFRAEVLRQRKLMGLTPPAVPSMALKAQVLAAAGMAASTAGGGGGASVGLGGSLGLAKVVTAALVLTATPVGGGILLRDDRAPHAHAPATRAAPAPTARVAGPARESAPAAERVAIGNPLGPQLPTGHRAPPARSPARTPGARPPGTAPAALVPPSPVVAGAGSSWPAAGEDASGGPRSPGTGDAHGGDAQGSGDGAGGPAEAKDNGPPKEARAQSSDGRRAAPPAGKEGKGRRAGAQDGQQNAGGGDAHTGGDSSGPGPGRSPGDGSPSTAPSLPALPGDAAACPVPSDGGDGCNASSSASQGLDGERKHRLSGD